MFNQIPPKVFVSYSWDSPELQNRVLNLSDTLRSEGVDCKIDQYYAQTQLPEGWHHWMMNQIEEANFVLIICTENYYLRYRGKVKDDVGLGVKWEGAIITQDLYIAGTLNHKCIPVLFTESGKLKYIPEPLRSSSYYCLNREYENLYRHLTRQQSTPMPELGKLRQLSPKERKQHFFNGTQNSEPKSVASLSEIPVPSFEASEVGVDYTKPQELPSQQSFTFETTSPISESQDDIEPLIEKARFLQLKEDKHQEAKEALEKLPLIIQRARQLEMETLDRFLNILKLRDEQPHSIKEALKNNTTVSIQNLKTLEILAKVIGIEETKIQSAIEKEREKEREPQRGQKEKVVGREVIKLIAHFLHLEEEKFELAYKNAKPRILDFNDKKRILSNNLEIQNYDSVELFFKLSPVEKNDFKKISLELNLDFTTILDTSFLKVLVLEVPKAKLHLGSYLQEKCNLLRVPYLKKPIKLNELYVEVNILEEPTSSERLGIFELPKIYDYKNDNFDRVGWRRRDEHLSGTEVAETYSKLMVLGKPGSGKSTFLQYLTIKCSDNEFLADRVPVFVQLKSLTNLDNPSLFCYIKQEFYHCGITNQNTVEELLKYGRVLILLDGLDEVSEKYIEKTIKEVQEFCQKYHRNHFIMSCRIAAQIYDFTDFTYVEVADFNQDQIKVFAQNWFKAIDVKSSDNGQAKAKQFIDKLSQEDNQQIRELAVTPILLGLTCLVFQKKGNFPSDKAELYKEGIEILLRIWDESRNIERDTIYKKLSIEHKKNLLIEVASHTFIHERYFFKTEQIISYIAKYVRRISSVIYSTPPEEEQLTRDSADILRAIEAHHGLLVERSHNIYSFSHLTFQEYFTAQAVTLHKETFDCAVNNFFKKNWRETFLLASNIFGSADSLLLASKKRSDTLLYSNEKIQRFLDWLHHKSCTIKTSYKPVTIRFFYFILALHNFLEINFSDTLEIISFDFSESNISSVTNFDTFLLRNSDIYKNLKSVIDLNIDPELVYDIALSILLDKSCKLNCRLESDSKLDYSLGMVEDLRKALLYLDDYCKSKKSNKIEQLISQLKPQSAKLPEDVYRLAEFWQLQGKTWTTELKTTIVEERNICLKWQFNDEHKKLMQQYYKANKLLIDCLYSRCTVSAPAWKQLEDTLLMPVSTD